MLTTEISAAIATITLNRPEVHNAFDDALIAALTSAFEAVSADPAVRVVVLTGAGQSFSAGGDLGWMRRMADYSRAQNLADAQALARLLKTIDTCPKPTIARVNGQAYAGGLGLIAACDIAIAVAGAQFAVTEARIGLIPSVISPYLVRAMGARACRRLFLTAERFDTAEAIRLGLVHEMVGPESLDAAVQSVADDLTKNSPAAVTAAKALIRMVDRPLDDALIEATAVSIADQRASPDGREGVQAFLEKRKPVWGTP
ncbi:MAG: enoyl-CoA hydratase/isomerase family protein [Alphaproteobacteria bacterium]|nr:enoyl-CoA hydratase/isomerase family protein [Alphaproteobacteria bacterium]TAD88147.1 MAG: enoyl-CoA hydratase/isomerase family protein [Alphaproteobacteria bacterium]